jgi:capsule polysaccharide export protein KpsC/LpsZ
MKATVMPARVNAEAWMQQMEETPAGRRRLASLAGRQIFAFGISPWKRPFLAAYFSQSHLVFAPQYLGDRAFIRTWRPRISAAADPVLLAWGTKLPSAAIRQAKETGIPLFYMEDGFLRSMLPSASKTRPVSLTLDSQRPYFDARGASDLEDFLNSDDFRPDQALLQRAREGIKALVTSGLSKYNQDGEVTMAIRTDRTVRTILVVGQVEDDASIRLGHQGTITNNDLVRLAAVENPGARLLYKPHPDVLRNLRRRRSNPQEVAHLCEILTEPLPLHRLLERVDHVYTITSLAGFEALMRGLTVTVVGLPFYAGWGLTDDRQPNARRKHRRSIEEVFAAAYLLYPHYFDPLTGEEISFEACLEMLAGWKTKGVPPLLLEPLPDYEEPNPHFHAWHWAGPYGLLGWRHLMTRPLAAAITAAGSQADAETFRKNPIGFFRNLSNPTLRRVGRLLYPWD